MWKKTSQAFNQSSYKERLKKTCNLNITSYQLILTSACLPVQEAGYVEKTMVFFIIIPYVAVCFLLAQIWIKTREYK